MRSNMKHTLAKYLAVLSLALAGAFLVPANGQCRLLPVAAAGVAVRPTRPAITPDTRIISPIPTTGADITAAPTSVGTTRAISRLMALAITVRDVAAAAEPRAIRPVAVLAAADAGHAACGCGSCGTGCGTCSAGLACADGCGCGAPSCGCGTGCASGCGTGIASGPGCSGSNPSGRRQKNQPPTRTMDFTPRPSPRTMTTPSRRPLVARKRRGQTRSIRLPLAVRQPAATSRRERSLRLRVASNEVKVTSRDPRAHERSGG